MVARKDKRGSQHAGQHSSDDEQAVCCAEAAGEPARAGDTGACEERVGDVEQRRLQAGEAEAGEDEVGEVLGAAVGDLRGQLERDEEPGFWVDETLAGLRPVPGCGGICAAAGAGEDDPCFSVVLFFGGEKACFGDGAGKEKPEYQGPEEGSQTEDNVHPAPGADGVGLADVPNAKGEEACDETADGVAREPETCTDGNFITCIKAGGQEHECRGDGGFSGAKKETDDEKAGVVCTGCGEGYDGAPDQSVEGEIRRYGDTGDQQVRRIGPGEVTEVKDGRNP